MLKALPHRHTHRGAFAPGPLPAGLLAGLQHDALAERATLALVDRAWPTSGWRTSSARSAAGWTLIRGPGQRCAGGAGRRPAPPGTASPRTRSRPRPPASRPPAGRLRQRDFDLGRGLGLLTAEEGRPPPHRGAAHPRRQPGRLASRRAGAAPAPAPRGEQVGVREPVYPAARKRPDPGADQGPPGAAGGTADATAAWPRPYHSCHRPPPPEDSSSRDRALPGRLGPGSSLDGAEAAAPPSPLATARVRIATTGSDWGAPVSDIGGRRRIAPPQRSFVAHAVAWRLPWRRRRRASGWACRARETSPAGPCRWTR